MPTKIRWGVLGVANIAVKKVIPAMQKGELCDITAIASRDKSKAEAAAQSLGISTAHGSYEDLLADPNVDAIYNPLPNHLHVPWSIKAAEAGKHVLCEKPIGLDTAEAHQLVAARDRTGVKIGEAFMVRTHPQWLRARELVQSGALGEIRSIQAAFSYNNVDPKNVRNVNGWGGGGLMDIGCYPIISSRFLLGREPKRVIGTIENCPNFNVDRLATALLDFDPVQVSFTCGTQMVPYQRLQVFGSKGRLEVEIPYNAPPDRPCRIFTDDGSSLFGAGIRTEEFPICDQYTIQGDLFSKAILENGEVPTPLEESVRNMAVIDAIFLSAKTSAWEVPVIS